MSNRSYCAYSSVLLNHFPVCKKPKVKLTASCLFGFALASTLFESSYATIRHVRR